MNELEQEQDPQETQKVRRKPTKPVQIRSGETTFWVLWNGTYAECRNCGGKIGFGCTKKGKWVPFNTLVEGVDCAEPHWATCPASKYYVPKGGDLPPPKTPF